MQALTDGCGVTGGDPLEQDVPSRSQNKVHVRAEPKMSERRITPDYQEKLVQNIQLPEDSKPTHWPWYPRYLTFGTWWP